MLMTPKQYQEKVETLKKWAYAYYVEDNPIATDGRVIDTNCTTKMLSIEVIGKGHHSQRLKEFAFPRELLP